ncbi:DUF2637 domain-containing protein [Actinocatenispora sera]|uniref:DUF2637 domain-containing protein n=1 Tax=Actinocatenispora sera TaxID=390989 RepID=UPI001BB3B68F|nr:DUF2637 domain-containing protein [Actinocatenispora sera]
MAEASKSQRVEDVARLGIMGAIGVMAGAASFTHMHDWTMQALPHGTADWFGWANAVASELMPTCALLEIRRKRRAGGSITYPVALLVASGLLSLGAQVSQAGDSLTSKGLAALPAVAFMLLVKLVFSGLRRPRMTRKLLSHNGSESPTRPLRRSSLPLRYLPRCLPLRCLAFLR